MMVTSLWFQILCETSFWVVLYEPVNLKSESHFPISTRSVTWMETAKCNCCCFECCLQTLHMFERFDCQMGLWMPLWCQSEMTNALTCAMAAMVNRWIVLSYCGMLINHHQSINTDCGRIRNSGMIIDVLFIPWNLMSWPFFQNSTLNFHQCHVHPPSPSHPPAWVQVKVPHCARWLWVPWDRMPLAPCRRRINRWKPSRSGAKSADFLFLGICFLRDDWVYLLIIVIIVIICYLLIICWLFVDYLLILSIFSHWFCTCLVGCDSFRGIVEMLLDCDLDVKRLASGRLIWNCPMWGLLGYFCRGCGWTPADLDFERVHCRWGRAEVTSRAL